LTPALGAGVMTMTSAGTGTPVTPADGTATVMPEHERHALRKQSFRSAGAWGITCTLAHHVHSSSGVCSVTAMCLFVRMSSSSDLSHFALRVRVLHTHTHTHTTGATASAWSLELAQVHHRMIKHPKRGARRREVTAALVPVPALGGHLKTTVKAGYCFIYLPVGYPIEVCAAQSIITDSDTAHWE